VRREVEGALDLVLVRIVLDLETETDIDTGDFLAQYLQIDLNRLLRMYPLERDASEVSHEVAPHLETETDIDTGDFLAQYLQIDLNRLLRMYPLERDASEVSHEACAACLSAAALYPSQPENGHPHPPKKMALPLVKYSCHNGPVP
jgi:uncharacterized protein (DUF2252 family)